MNPLRRGRGKEMEDNVWEGMRFSVHGLRGRERGRELDGCDSKIASV